MAAGRKPDLSIQAYARNTPSGQKRNYLDIGAAWENQYGLSMMLARGVMIRLPDGTIITGDSHFINIRDWRQGRPGSAGGSQKGIDWNQQGAQGGQRLDAFGLPAGQPASPGDEDPFERAKRIAEEAQRGFRDAGGQPPPEDDAPPPGDDDILF
jgi:hypothetical protein